MVEEIVQVQHKVLKCDRCGKSISDWDYGRYCDICKKDVCSECLYQLEIDDIGGDYPKKIKCCKAHDELWNLVRNAVVDMEKSRSEEYTRHDKIVEEYEEVFWSQIKNIRTMVKE